MKPIIGEIVIAAPIESVFDFVADESNEPLYNPKMVQVEKLTPGPVGLGTRYAAVMKGRRRTRVTIECTGFNRPRSLKSSSRTTGMDITGELTFAPQGKHCRLRWIWRLEPHGPLRLLGPLVRAVGNRQEQANWLALKKYLELRQPAGTA